MNYYKGGKVWTGSPLHYASWKGHLSTIELLLSAGADIESTDALLYTPLHHATAEGHYEAIRILLEHGASQAAVDKEGMTPLDWAFEKRKPDIIQ